MYKDKWELFDQDEACDSRIEITDVIFPVIYITVAEIEFVTPSG